VTAAHADDEDSDAPYRFPRRELRAGERVRIGDRTGRRGVVLHAYADGSVVIRWRSSPNGAVLTGRFHSGQVVRE